MNKARSIFSFSWFLVAACSGGGNDPTPDAAVTCGSETFYRDSDGDGFGDDGDTQCQATAGYVAKGGDCDDGAAGINPSAVEGCDAIDNNCDGLVDDADPQVNTSAGTLYHKDADGDGFGSASQTKRACVQPSGFTANATDCDDAKAAVHPGATEVCDQIDNDCDGDIDIADSGLDLSTATAYFRDTDGDQFGTGTATLACSQPSGFVQAAGDCNDADALSHPGGTEICDGADNDCDGGNDGTAAAPNQCTAFAGTFASASYQHLAQEKLGNTVINSMSCSGTGNGVVQLNRAQALQGTFNCIYNGGLGGFDQTQPAVLKATVKLDGTVTGTIEHTYESGSFGTGKRTYNVTGTLSQHNLTLSGTGSFFPNPMSAVAWQVSFSSAGSK